MSKHAVENFLPKFKTSKHYGSLMEEVKRHFPSWPRARREAAAGYIWYRRSMCSIFCIKDVKGTISKIKESTFTKYMMILSNRYKNGTR